MAGNKFNTKFEEIKPLDYTLKFKKFLGALESKDYKTASEEMMDSRWATQVGPRAVRLRDRVKNA